VFVGGSTQLVVDLMEHLGHKYEMEVVTAALPARGRHSGMTIHHLPLPGNVTVFHSLLQRVQPDLLHVHYWGSTDQPWYDALFEAAETRGCRVLQNINTPVAPHQSRSLVRNVFVSRYARSLAGASTVPQRVIHPGIDLELFKPPAAFDARAMDSVGMVYRLEPDKLNDASIMPLIEVAKRRPRTRVFVIGDGTLFDAFVRAVKAAGVWDNFAFTGSVPFAMLPHWYSQFRTFAAPVWQESWGQVSTFAMAMGLAVAGNRVGALPEILESDETLGASVDETAARMVALLDSPARIEALGKRNRQIALQRFSIGDMVAAYDQTYQELVGVPADPMPGFPAAKLFPAE
jgi:glycosyltransferase involved in cell wall biosynthesis